MQNYSYLEHRPIIEVTKALNYFEERIRLAKRTRLRSWLYLALPQMEAGRNKCIELLTKNP